MLRFLGLYKGNHRAKIFVMVTQLPSVPFKNFLIALATVFLLVAMAVHAQAYSEAYAGPKELIDRSDYIVVGHIEGESFPRVENDQNEDYHAVLVITERIKGNLPLGKTPVVIRSDLKPETWQSNLILVGGGMHGPVSGNIQQDRIWFLRLGDPKEANGQNSVGISKGQDTDDLEMKPYYLAFMSRDPLAELRKYTQGKGKLAERSRWYVDEKDIEHISQIPDLDERLDKLLPYYLQNSSQDPYSQRQAEQLIVATGEAGVRKLVPLYENTADESVKIGIISTLTRMGYRDADPLLATMLEKEDQFWARQYVRANNWWTSEEPDPSSDQARNVSKARMDAILAALDGTHDPRALEVIARVNKRWQNWQGWILSDPDPYP